MEMYMRFQNIFKQKCTEMDKKIAIELSRCATACQGCGCSDSFI